MAEIDRQAALSCLACRRDKRRCDRVYPSCGLCQKKESQCQYPGARKERKTQKVHGLSNGQRHTVPEQIHTANEFPATYFLAPEVFRAARLELPRPKIIIPEDILAELGDLANVRHLAERYFNTVHSWFPIILKWHFYRHLLNPVSQHKTELYMLAASMKLAVSSAGELDMKFYNAVKQFYFEIETKEFLSLSILQAGILIALSELGHAVYPAAYLSIGSCARYGVAIGIDRDLKRKSSDSDPSSLDVLEEKRRTWWSILILDRFTTLNDPSRALCTEDPETETYLPVEDDHFGEGQITPESAIRVCDMSSLLMGKFCRLTQGVHLLSRTLQHIRRDPTGDPLYHQDGRQLRRTIIALLDLCDIEFDLRRLDICDLSAACYSSLLLLDKHDRLGHSYNPPEHDDVGLSDESSIALEFAAKEATRLLKKHSRGNPTSSLEGLSIFTLQFAYQATSTLVTFRSSTPHPASDKSMADLKQLLRIWAKRWRGADAYLEIIDAQEMLSVSR